ncbi:DUF3732 domain-containing protein (plasmid) [Streptomyces globisporus]|uniref:DUF3732 domain-containing protein n=1 Tax=Streptomyces globisporus TaxID=1908 RepID=UPI002F906E5F|nr:DUF3732 domain-containing protein [Streptomyces globisporus]
MLDQPTQPYYPSDMARARGRLEDLALDEDRVTVTGLFRLMHQVVTELSPDFQIIELLQPEPRSRAVHRV